MRLSVDDIAFDANGLVPAVVQDESSREVLTVAYMNRESLAQTLETGQTWFWSRSRSQLWHKGETSGNTQSVVDVRVDCDFDSIVVRVKPSGPACHTGARSCFHNEIDSAVDKLAQKGTAEEENIGDALTGLFEVIESRKASRPEGSYTTYLFDQGLDKILKKVGEEASETIIAAKNDEPGSLTSEMADLIYHLLVLMVERGVSLQDIGNELSRRRAPTDSHE